MLLFIIIVNIKILLLKQYCGSLTLLVNIYTMHNQGYA